MLREERDSESVEARANLWGTTHAEGSLVMKHPSPARAFGHKVVFSRARDGRWIADVPALPGVTAFGFTRKQARDAVELLALKAIVDGMGKLASR